MYSFILFKYAFFVPVNLCFVNMSFENHLQRLGRTTKNYKTA